MIYLPDTNTLSCFMRGRDVRLRDLVIARLADCQLSTVVLSELEYGAEKRPEVKAFRERLEQLRTAFPVPAVFDEEAAFHTGRIRAHLANLKPNAQPIGPYDAMLAGQALSMGATVITHNTREFSRVPGLKIDDWQT